MFKRAVHPGEILAFGGLLGGLQIDLEELLGVGVDIIDAAGLEAKHAAILHDAIPL